MKKKIQPLMTKTLYGQRFANMKVALSSLTKVFKRYVKKHPINTRPHINILCIPTQHMLSTANPNRQSPTLELKGQGYISNLSLSNYI